MYSWHLKADKPLIGFQKISNDQLISLCEKVINYISLERIKKRDEWAEEFLAYVNRTNWFTRNIGFLQSKSYTFEDVTNEKFWDSETLPDIFMGLVT